MLTIIDYGLGNIQSFQNLYKRLNIETRIAKTENDLINSTKLILPGVGAFDHAMDLFNNSGMRERAESLVLQDQTPILGVCVGMQILANSSEEGTKTGLGWIPGTVKKFLPSSNQQQKLPLPHMGWNDVIPSIPNNPFFQNLENDSRFYFLHSYYFECKNMYHMSATSDYGIKFSSAIQNNNIYGVQFHPEKSHHYGEQLLKNFANL